MDVKTTLNPGDKGTKNLVKKYGEKLIAVRYRYDKIRRMRYKTVELIEDERVWIPVLHYRPDQQVPIKINYAEQTLREQLKAHGGYWDKKRKVWLVRYQAVLELKLENRMIID